jgi:hypothetical protein
MTINDFASLVMSIDPNAVRYEAIGQKGDSYTVYAEYKTRVLYANGIPSETAISVQVDYYTKKENDPRMQDFFNAFTSNEEITCEYSTDFESDTRYIHHIFDCEVMK